LDKIYSLQTAAASRLRAATNFTKWMESGWEVSVPLPSNRCWRHCRRPI